MAPSIKQLALDLGSGPGDLRVVRLSPASSLQWAPCSAVNLCVSLCPFSPSAPSLSSLSLSLINTSLQNFKRICRQDESELVLVRMENQPCRKPSENNSMSPTLKEGGGHGPKKSLEIKFSRSSLLLSSFILYLSPPPSPVFLHRAPPSLSFKTTPS